MTADAMRQLCPRSRGRSFNVVCSTMCAVSMAAVLLVTGADAMAARVVPPPVTSAVIDYTLFDYDHPPTAHTVQRNDISLQQATVLATRRFPGRVVRAETVVTGGRRVHVIRILNEDNRVRTVRIDADTGNILQ